MQKLTKTQKELKRTAFEKLFLNFLLDAVKHETALNLLMNASLVCGHYELCAMIRDIRNEIFKPTKDKKKLQEFEHYLNMQIKDCREHIEKEKRIDHHSNHLTIHLAERSIILYENLLEHLHNKK